jgi:hypothetical protein
MPTQTPLPGSVCENFAVHAEDAITFDSGESTTICGGDIGVTAGVEAITGPPYIIEDGELVNPTTAFTNSVKNAWNAAMAPTPYNDPPYGHREMGGTTYIPGTWRSSTIKVEADTIVTLDGQNDPNSVFLFQTDTTMVTGVGSQIILINGAKAENVLWALGTALTTGTTNVFRGSILAGTAITIGIGTTIHGDVVAKKSITFGTNVAVHGCVLAGEITFGTTCSITVSPNDCDPPP